MFNYAQPPATEKEKAWIASVLILLAIIVSATIVALVNHQYDSRFEFLIPGILIFAVVRVLRLGILQLRLQKVAYELSSEKLSISKEGRTLASISAAEIYDYHFHTTSGCVSPKPRFLCRLSQAGALLSAVAEVLRLLVVSPPYLRTQSDKIFLPGVFRVNRVRMPPHLALNEELEKFLGK